MALFREAVLLCSVMTEERSRVFDFLSELSAGATIVCEDYVTAQLMHDGRMTLKLIGAIEREAQLTRVQFVLQRPQARLPFMAQARALLGKKQPTGRPWTPHHIDAVAHALCYLHKQAPSVPVESYQTAASLWVEG